MAERPKISIKPHAAARNPHRRPVRALTAPRPPVERAPEAPLAASRPSRRQDTRPRPENEAEPARHRVTPPAADRTPRPARPQWSEAPPGGAPKPQRASPQRPFAPSNVAPSNVAPPNVAPPNVAPRRRADSQPQQQAQQPQQPPRPASPATLGVRISKLITDRGLASRREADDWIAAGWVSVGGRPAVLGQRAPADAVIDIHTLAQTAQATRVTVLLHKPIGFVSGQAEDGHEPAVKLFTPANRWAGDASDTRFHPGQQRGLAPAGRLDIDSTGLLVLTQDGRIAKQLVGDQTRVEKEYLVRVQRLDGGPLAEVPLTRLQHGLELDGVALRPARVSWQNEDQLRVVLREGRKRQIRRMCELVGLKVVGLKRVRIGSVVLGPLPPGQWRYLGEHERF